MLFKSAGLEHAVEGYLRPPLGGPVRWVVWIGFCSFKLRDIHKITLGPLYKGHAGVALEVGQGDVDRRPAPDPLAAPGLTVRRQEQDGQAQGVARLLKPGEAELAENPRSRSAQLRVLEKM